MTTIQDNLDRLTAFPLVADGSVAHVNVEKLRVLESEVLSPHSSHIFTLIENVLDATQRIVSPLDHVFVSVVIP